MIECRLAMAHLTPFHIIPALVAAVSHAGEITVEIRPFTVEKSFVATALPDGDCTLVKLRPKTWADFEITHITAHGSKVTKGDSLIRFDEEGIERKLEDSRRALEVGELSLAQAELDSKLFEETAKNKWEAIRRAAAIAKEENTYFTQVKRKAKEEAAGQALNRSNQILSNQREELKQLSMMYKADDITENTEEIILVRQQDAVAAAEFAQRMENIDHKRTLEITLPREAQTLADSERDTSISLKKAETDIPRSIKLNKLELESLKTTHRRAKQQLEELEADRALFEFKAPADGYFYHGPMENGRWTPAEVAKSLVIHGHPPAHTSLATFVPHTAKMSLVAFLDEATARSLTANAAGMATLAGREDVDIPVKLLKLSSVPNPDGTYRADLAVSLPEGLAAAGGTVRVRLISYQKAAATAIPTRAISFGPEGWTVEVRLADGKTERRVVKGGRVSNDDTEILSGLEVGQVIVVP